MIRSIVFDIKAVVSDVANPVFLPNIFELLLRLRSCNLRLAVCSDELTQANLDLILMQTQIRHFFDYKFGTDNVEYDLYEYAIDFMGFHPLECLIFSSSHIDLDELKTNCISFPSNKVKTIEELTFSYFEEELQVLRIKGGVIEILDGINDINASNEFELI